jgi:phosphate-selective porin OprO/OprP
MSFSPRSRLTPALLALALASVTATAQAADATLELLAQKGIITAEEYAKLKAGQQDSATLSLKDGIKISSADGKSTAQLGLLLQLDTAYLDRDTGDLPSGSEMRRVRLALGGKSNAWSYRMEAEFAGNVVLTDAWTAWNGPVTVTAGHFKQPYSLEALMSDKDLAFMERSLTSSLLAVRAPGLMVSDGGDAWSWAAGVFGEPLSTASTDDEGGGLSARGSWVPIIGDSSVLHLASSLHWRKPTQSFPTAGAETWSLASKPEINLVPNGERFLNTGTIANVSDYYLFSLEAAKAFGPLLTQAEYNWVQIDRNQATGSRLDFKGGSAQASWALTGEVRPYTANRGLFGGIKPKGDVAWEVALRLSEMDLLDGTINGGREQNASASLNAYVGPSIKFSVNAIQVLDVDRGPKATADKPRALMMRAQFAY